MKKYYILLFLITFSLGTSTTPEECDKVATVNKVFTYVHSQIRRILWPTTVYADEYDNLADAIDALSAPDKTRLMLEPKTYSIVETDIISS